MGSHVTRKERSRLANPPHPRINVYICQRCGTYTVTVDVDKGVTPFMIGCQNGTTDCTGDAYSQMYPSGPKPAWIPEPQWEWYKPTGEAYDKLSLAMKEHIDNGGLNIRRRTDAEPITHGIEEGWDGR